MMTLNVARRLAVVGLVIGLVILVYVGLSPGSDPVSREAWSTLRLEGAIWPENYGTVAEITAASIQPPPLDGEALLGAGVVVRAEITAVLPGRVKGPSDDPAQQVSHIHLVLAITETLGAHSSLKALGPTLVLELTNPGTAEVSVPSLNEALQGDHGLFFLRNLGDEAARFGLGNTAQVEDSSFWRTVSPEGIVIDDQGNAFVPLASPDGSFAQSVNGRPFGDVIAEAKTAAAALS